LKNKNFEKRKIESGILKIENWKNEKGKRFNLGKLMVKNFNSNKNMDCKRKRENVFLK
jgi:hypothetical protein